MGSNDPHVHWSLRQRALHRSRTVPRQTLVNSFPCPTRHPANGCASACLLHSYLTTPRITPIFDIRATCSLRRSPRRCLGLWRRLLLPALPGAALARGSAGHRPALPGVLPGLFELAARGVRMPADDQQPEPTGMPTRHPEDA